MQGCEAALVNEMSDDVRYQDASPTSTPFEVAAPRGTNQVIGRKSALRRPKAAPMPSATPPVYDFSIQADTSWLRLRDGFVADALAALRSLDLNVELHLLKRFLHNSQMV